MPFKSRAQAAYFNIHKKEMEAQGIDVGEWDRASKGKKLPYHVNRGGTIQSALNTAKKYAEGGEVNEWGDLPKSPEGRPQITVTKPPSPSELVSKYTRKATDWFSQPSQIKPETPPAPEFNAAPGQEIGIGIRSIGQGMAEHYKDLVDPFAKNEEGKYVAEQPIPETPGKIPEAIKSDRATPILGEVASTFAGPPGQGIGWGLLKGAGAGIMGAAAKTTAKSAVRQGFMDTSHFKSISLSKGTMPGGFKVDPATGTEWYVKQAPNLEQAKNEKLTAELYKLFGVPVADVHLTTVGGKPGIASKKIEGTQLSNTDIPHDEIKDLHGPYPVHAMLANHDAVGTGPENPLGNIIVDKSGQAHVIDTGGGLLYKGTGTKKPNFTPEVPELHTMADPNYSELSAHIFGNVNWDKEKIWAQKIADTDERAMADLVERYGPKDRMERLTLLSTLLKRKHNIQESYGVSPTKAAKPQHEQFEQIPFEDFHVPEAPANKNDPKAIHEFLKNLNDPASAEEIFRQLPPNIKQEIDKIIESESGPEAAATQYQKDVAEYEQKLDSAIDKPQRYIKGMKANQWFAQADSFAINQRFNELVKPIENWPEWRPRNEKIKPLSLVHKSTEDVKKLGFNPNVPVHHGSHTEIYETLHDPKTFKPEWDERAFFAADEPIASAQYGPNMKTYIARAPNAMEVDWNKWSGRTRYDHQAMKALIEAGHRHGVDMIASHNMRDMGSDQIGLHTQYLFLKTENLRQALAKFDPAKLHLKDTMAGITGLAGGGSFVYGNIQREPKESKMNRGGIPALLHRAKKLASGGPADKSGGYHPRHPAGMIKSSIPGRTDKIPMSVPPGSYILPADIPSALGQGNTMAGEKILGTMFRSGPNSPGSTAQLSGRLPKGPRPPRMPHLQMIRPIRSKFADGGEAEQSGNEDVPIIAAGGEHVIYPDQVKEVGHGDLNAGHRVLDKFVLSVRKRHIETLKSLKPPKT